jgi:hypothetical protein
MMGGGIFVLFALLAVALIAGALISAARRRDAAKAVATSLGMQYATGDPLDLVHLQHRLFRKGDERRIDTTLYGDLGGRRVALCDYVYTDVTHDADGVRHESNTRLSLCAVDLDYPLPWIAVSPESLGRRFLNAIAVGNDVQYESDEFNRAFEVLSADRDFAYTLIDTEMMAWLMATSRSIQIEIDDTRLIAAARQLPWEQMPAFAEKTLEFHRQIPPLVAEKYGPGR